MATNNFSYTQWANGDRQSIGSFGTVYCGFLPSETAKTLENEHEDGVGFNGGWNLDLLNVRKLATTTDHHKRPGITEVLYHRPRYCTTDWQLIS